MESTEQPVQPGPSLQDKLGPQIEEARKNLTDLNDKAVKFIRTHPGACLLGALAFGYVVGRIASRR